MNERTDLMSSEQVESVLMEHAAALVEGLDIGEQLLSSYPQVRGVLGGLFGLAKRLSEVLVPVEPADAFVVELREQLVKIGAEQSVCFSRLRDNRKTVLQIAGVAGLMISGLAMLALGVRFIIALVSRRRATTIA